MLLKFQCFNGGRFNYIHSIRILLLRLAALSHVNRISLGNASIFILLNVVVSILLPALLSITVTVYKRWMHKYRDVVHLVAWRLRRPPQPVSYDSNPPI